MAGVSITCHLCGESFDERTLEGGWLDRRCPRCGGKLDEEGYDAAAADVIARHRPQLGKRGAKTLERLALARYYTSEWFRLACAGQGSKAPDKGLFGLRPGYDHASGTFELIPGDDDRSPDGGWGVSGEYFVFDALRRAIAAEKRAERDATPLSDALLAPVLVFPWLPGQKPKQWGASCRAETDCIVLCRSCAVIVEVKRRNHHVKASPDARHARERSQDGSFRPASEVFEQVERGADSFAERQQLYPKNRIFKLVVYVDPLSFEQMGPKQGKPARPFADGIHVGWLQTGGEEHFVDAVRDLIQRLDPIASSEEVAALAAEMLERFGNTKERRAGRIVVGSRPFPGRRMRRTAAMLASIERACNDERSPLFGARLLQNLLCEVQTGRRDREAHTKQVDLSGLLLTRTHVVFIDAKRWPVHVNTHVPFATVYTGDPADGAEHVQADIRHDWDLEEINYTNRSGSLTLSNYIAKSMPEVDCYRERNRVCSMHVFVDAVTYFADCDTFRQKAFIGYWKGREGNVVPALEALVAEAEPIMSQKALDKLANRLASIGQ